LAAGPLKAQKAPPIPLRTGLTIVHAIANPQADYETIIQFTAVDSEAVRLTVNFPPRAQRSHEARRLAGDSARMDVLTAVRIVRRQDLRSARHYMLQWNTAHPETIPGTTALGASAAIYDALKRNGMTMFHLGIPGGAGADKNLFYFEDLGRRPILLRRVEQDAVLLPVIVNDVRVQLPAIHARGQVAGVVAEFWFLDDRENPLALKWQIDKQHLQVSAITFQAAEQSARVAATLETSGRVELHGIYFDVGSATIKPQSEPVLKEIADAMARHPKWKLAIEGHTDSVGGVAYNQQLSEARATAVRQALVARHQVAADRLTTEGFGASRPKETNTTIEGRARNRRVELARIDVP
jgi:outer membrane protein OmpA-like peptidoglycan-associated protein